MKITLRDYQKTDAARILKSFKTHCRVCYCLPTGGGKTYVACEVIRRGFKKVLFLAHRVEIIRQMRRSMAALGISADQVVLHSPFTASTHLTATEAIGFDLIIIDEAHHAGMPTYRALASWLQHAKVLGLTASPHRAGGLKQDFDELIHGPLVDELIARNVVHAPKCWSVPPDREPELAKVKVVAGDYHRGELELAVNKPQLVSDIVREYEAHASGRSALVYAVGVKHGHSIASQFVRAGHDARMVDAGTPDTVREQIVADFDAGKFPVLVNAILFTEGIDIHRIDCLILARPTKSLVLYLQAVGRAMRPSPTGLTPIVLDHSGAVMRHGLPDMPRRWTLERTIRGGGGGGPQPCRRCAKCGWIMHWTALECPTCKAVVRISEEETSLVAVDDWQSRLKTLVANGIVTEDVAAKFAEAKRRT